MVGVFIRIGVPFLVGLGLSILKRHFKNKQIRRDLLEEVRRKSELKK